MTSGSQWFSGFVHSARAFVPKDKLTCKAASTEHSNRGAIWPHIEAIQFTN
jgi:hypothetical protein